MVRGLEEDLDCVAIFDYNKTAFREVFAMGKVRMAKHVRQSTYGYIIRRIRPEGTHKGRYFENRFATTMRGYPY